MRPTSPLSWLAAAGLGVGAYVHLCLYRHGYRFIPIIGVLFAINVITSAAVSLALVLLARRVVVRLAGIAVAAGTLAAFGASRLPGGLFHFQERGLQPSPQSTVALIAETVAITALVIAIAADHRHRRVVPDPRPSRNTRQAGVLISRRSTEWVGIREQHPRL